MQKQADPPSKSKDQIMSHPKKTYYQAEVNKGCCSDEFDLRYDSIKYDSLVSKGFCAKLCSFFKWGCTYQNLGVPKDQKELERLLPINKNPNFECPPNKIRYTWIGHSTAVISLGGKVNILIDPVFSNRCSPFQFAGPKRFRDPAVPIKGLPRIDLVLVSHDHYDHLDENSLNEIESLHHPHYFAGLNSGDVFPGSKERMHELDWTQSESININGQKLEITFVPACHWGRRGLLDQNKRLWGGFVVRTANNRQIYYSGDTGYCPVFKEIGEHFGKFDLCVLPIGAYEPRQLLKDQHVNPEEAVVCHKQLNSKKSVGVHWGTFPLGYEHWCAARSDLEEAVKRHGLKQDEFVTVGHGDSLQVDF